jgi:purine-nucleoside phosphorylase
VEALEATQGVAVSLDSLHQPEAERPSLLAQAADMQTAALLQTAREQSVAAAAVLIVAEKSDSGQLQDEDSGTAAKRAGRGAVRVLSA